MPILTGAETTADMTAVRLFLRDINPDLNVPSVRLAVWSAYAGLSTRTDLAADLAAVEDIPRLCRRLYPEEISGLVNEVFTGSHPEIDRHF